MQENTRQAFKDQSSKGIGILGGTFDPIHNAHLACAQAVKDFFHLDSIKFIPCATTPHRDQPLRSSEQRCEMTRLAIAGHEGFELDERECQREGLSYTVDTLRSLREDLGETLPLLFVLGTDAFEKFDTWHNYQKVLELCHLVVVSRPEHELENETVKKIVEEHQCSEKDTLMKKPGGCIFFLEGPMLDISATRIRNYFNLDMPNVSENIKALSREIPESVKQYIHQHGLYQERQY